MGQKLSFSIVFDRFFISFNRSFVGFLMFSRFPAIYSGLFTLKANIGLTRVG